MDVDPSSLDVDPTSVCAGIYDGNTEAMDLSQSKESTPHNTDSN